MHEVLTIGVYFTFLRYNPWQWSNVPFMGKLGITLSSILDHQYLDLHYATKHGALTDTLRDVAQASWCIPEAIWKLLLMMFNNMDILLQQDLSILYFILLNVTSVLYLDSWVFLSEVTAKITKHQYISLDILPWMLYDYVLQELSPN